MKTTRRSFLTVAGSSALVSFAPQVPLFLRRAVAAEAASGEEGGDNVLVVVQLSGGNDGLNTVIPYGDDVYHRNRFSLDVGRNNVRKINDYVGLHPQMDGLSQLLEDGHLAIVQGVGYPNPNRSHFESMDIWHTARRDVPTQPTGWLGRGLDAAQQSGGDLPAVHLGGEVQPLALTGRDVPVPSLQSLDGFRLRTGGDAQLKRTILAAAESKRNGDELLGFLQSNTSAAFLASQRVERAVKDYQTSASYPQSGLARKLRSVAQLIKAGLKTRIYYLTLGGFDTHANQRDAHAALLRELSGAVHAFLEDVAAGGHGQRLLLMTFSEFGRRVKENASGGTDHGAAAPMFLAGQNVNSGLIGEHPSLTDLEDGDVKFHTDFRRVYAGVLRDWLRWDPAPVLGKQFAPLQVVRT